MNSVHVLYILYSSCWMKRLKCWLGSLCYFICYNALVWYVPFYWYFNSSLISDLHTKSHWIFWAVLDGKPASYDLVQEGGLQKLFNYRGWGSTKMHVSSVIQCLTVQHVAISDCRWEKSPPPPPKTKKTKTGTITSVYPRKMLISVWV